MIEPNVYGWPQELRFLMKTMIMLLLSFVALNAKADDIANIVSVSYVTDGQSRCMTVTETENPSNPLNPIRGQREAKGCFSLIANYQRRISDNVFINVGLGEAGAKQIGVGWGW